MSYHVQNVSVADLAPVRSNSRESCRGVERSAELELPMTDAATVGVGETEAEALQSCLSKIENTSIEDLFPRKPSPSD